MPKFNTAHTFTARWEGGLSDHPADRGGITAYGASIEFVSDLASTPAGQEFLASIGVPLPVNRTNMRSVTQEQARAMFRYAFWDALGLDRLPLRPGCILYDMAVNHGPGNAVRIAQRGYNRCVLHGTKLAVDGKLGPQTIAALSKDTPKINAAILDAREDFYADIVQRDPSQSVFLKGWMNRLNGLRKLVEGLPHD